MKIAISSGHGKYVRGASGYIDEVDEARKVVEATAEYLAGAGVGVETFHDNTSTSQSTNLSTITNWHNSRSRDLDVSVHFNAYQTTSKPMGVEVLYVTQSKLATDLSAAMAEVMGLPNRGAKYRGDLYFLNNTSKPAILIETCFVDSSADADTYDENFNDVCRRIAEVIGKVDISKPPPEPPQPPEEVEENRVDITTKVVGNVIVNFNGVNFVTGEENTSNRVVVNLTTEGDVTVTINGQDYHNIEPNPPTKPGFPTNQMDIICTVFGGASDPNNSAYAPYEYIDDTVKGVALPWKFPGERQQVLVANRETGKEVVADIVDLGPWLTDDNYFETGQRPLAETCWRDGEPLPRGPNEGKVPNGAGIDLTPGAANAIGLSGKGYVHWRFLSEDETS